MELKNCSRVYKTKLNQTIALNDISYKFELGRFYAIMGHSGSGKSTLIQILGMLDESYEGTYLYEGIDTKILNDQEKANIRRDDIGFVFQDYQLHAYLNAFENVLAPLLINKKMKHSEKESRAKKLLEQVGFHNDKMHHFPRELSGGEQQRVAFARALANNPKYILADEPSGNLDEANEKAIFNMLKDFSKNGKCVIVVSHSNEIKGYADTILMMKNGALEEEI